MRPYRRACIAGRTARPSSTGLLTKKSSWARWPAQVDLGHRGFGLRAGGVEDQHIDRAEAAGDRGGQPGDLVLVGDIGAEARGGAAIGTDGAADRSYLFVAGPAIDRDGETVTRQPPRDHRPQPPRAARHQRDTPIRHSHTAIIPLARLTGQAPNMSR